MRRSILPAICVAALLLALSARAEEAADANVCLVLDKGLSRDGGEWRELELEFRLRGGKCGAEGWGHAMWFGAGVHTPRIVKDEVAGGVRKLTVEVELAPEPARAGGWARYEITLAREGEQFEGAFTGVVKLGGIPWPGGVDHMLPRALRKAEPGAADEEQAVPDFGEGAWRTEGRVQGRLGEAWPGVVAGHVRPAPGEHPRLAFRKQDLPLLRKRAAETPEGKAILARTLALLADEGTPKKDALAALFSTWPAVGHGFVYRMTGEASAAQKAREIVSQTIFGEALGRQGSKGVVQDTHHAPRLLGLALAYDLCYDAWEPAFRQKCADEIQRRTWELFLGEFEGQPMAGGEPKPWTSRYGIRAACAGVGALAVLGDTNLLGRVMEDAEAIAEQCAYQVRLHYLTSGLGGSGWCMEGDGARQASAERGLPCFAPCYANVLGKRLDAGTLCDFEIVGPLLEDARPSNTVWALSLFTVPADMLPGVKPLFDEDVGLKGNRTFGVVNPIVAPFIMASYPYDVAARPPGECLRWVAPDPRKGRWVFRATYGDVFGDIYMVLYMYSESLKGSWSSARGLKKNCGQYLQGIGLVWANGKHLVKVNAVPEGNSFHGGQLTSWRTTPDRTCVMNWDMDRAYLVPLTLKKGEDPETAAENRGAALMRLPYWDENFLDYGVRATRSMAVDCSGKSGCPFLVAQVECVRRVGTPGTSPAPPPGESAGAFARWWLPDAAGPIAVQGNTWVMGDAKEGPCLSGVAVEPLRMMPKYAGADSDDGRFFIVYTLQNGPPPEFKVNGQGLDATVTIGKRTIRFADGTLILE